MFRNIFRKSKNIKLGRWNTNKKSDTINRQIDLANCDSCGTCGINDSKSIKIKIRLPLTSKINFSSNFKSFSDISTKCCCFNDVREIKHCLCFSDFYSEKKEIKFDKEK